MAKRPGVQSTQPDKKDRVTPGAKVVNLCKHGQDRENLCSACEAEDWGKDFECEEQGKDHRVSVHPIASVDALAIDGKSILKSQFEYNVLELGIYPSDMRQALNTAAEDNWRMVGVAQRGSITIAFLEREKKNHT
jgi:hypothetical protein